MFRATKIHQISPKQDTFHKNLRFFIKNLRFFLQITKKAVPLHPHFEKCIRKFGVWCNGNTADSGPAFPGSSPGTPTKRVAKFCDSFFVIILLTQNYFMVSVPFTSIFCPMVSVVASVVMLLIHPSACRS